MPDWIKRGLWTSAEAVLGYLAVGLPTIDFTQDKSAIKSALIGLGISAVAGGLGALRNYIKEHNDW